MPKRPHSPCGTACQQNAHTTSSQDGHKSLLCTTTLNGTMLGCTGCHNMGAVCEPRDVHLRLARLARAKRPMRTCRYRHTAICDGLGSLGHCWAGLAGCQHPKLLLLLRWSKEAVPRQRLDLGKHVPSCYGQMAVLATNWQCWSNWTNACPAGFRWWPVHVTCTRAMLFC